MSTLPGGVPGDIALHDISTGRAVPGAGPSGQQVLLLLDGKPVVLESLFGHSMQVLTTSGMVDLPGGVELEEYYSATPEEIERLETLASEMLSPDGSDEDEEGGGDIGILPELFPFQGLSVVTPQGGILVIHSDMLVTVPMRNIWSSGDTMTVDDVLTHLDRMKVHDDHGRFGPDHDPQHDDPQHAPPVDHTLLNLTGASEALRIDLSTKEYVPVAGGDAVPITDDVVNVVGAADHDNVIIGDDRDNKLTGGEHSDRILGMGGNDTIYMNTFLDSSDTINGGDGDDDVLSFTQSSANPTDALDGVTNVEYVLLGDADTSLSVTEDIMTAISQSMTIDARAIVSGGNLVFDGSAESQGAFSVYGSEAGDDITGGTGNDTLDGGTGGDALTGGAGNDNLLGGAGTDSLIGGTGNDTLEGGAGADRLDGGGGTNTLSYASSGTGVNVSLKSGSASGGDAEGDTVADWASFQNLTGSSSGDTLEGSTGVDNKLEGGDGNDLLKYTTGADTLDGGGGSDTFYFDADADSGTAISGGEGSDVLRAGGSIDYSAATISGVEDVFIGDGQYARFGSSQIDSGWTVNGTTGAQEFRIQMNSAAADLSGLAFIAWTAGEDVVSIFGTANDETITGSSENDSITSGGGVDSISGGAGNDTISLSADTGSSSAIDGGSGNDVLTISGTVDLHNAASIHNIETMALDGASSLTLSAADAHEKDWTVTGAAGTTVNVSGTVAGEETDLGDLDLTGFDGELKYSGGNGNDTLDMGTNLDSSVYVDGGAGTDSLTFTYSGDTGSLDHVTNVEYIKLGDALTTLTLTNDSLVASDKSVTIDGSGLTHKFNFNGSNESDDLHILSGDGNDSLVGGAGDDTFSGGAGADTMWGGSGFDYVSYEGSPEGVKLYLALNDHRGGWAQGDKIMPDIEGIFGSAHNDTFYGSNYDVHQYYGMDGDDLFIIDLNDDTICGGSGNDTLTLSGGKQTILYESTSEVVQYTDTIKNFRAGQYIDKLVFDASFMRGWVGNLNSAEFIYGTSTELDGPCFLFHSNTLYYDADGKGDAEAHAVAVFEDMYGTLGISDIELTNL